MARWQPDARGRLVRAAVELFGERGYGPTTTAQIAEHAGVTKTTFFRHFSDKREVLFAGQVQLMELARGGVVAAPDDAGPLRAVAAGVDAMASAFGEEQREYGLQLQTVIAAHVELMERAAFKRFSIATEVTGALHDRGVGEPHASLAADVGISAFYLSYQRWVEPSNVRTFSDLAREAMASLARSADLLGQEFSTGAEGPQT